VDRIIDVVHVFMLLLFVGWGIFFVHCLRRYRQKPGHAATYQPVKAKVSKYVEVAVGIFEAILLLVFSMPVWAEYKSSPPPADQRMEVRVVGEQFQWDFHYAGKDGVFGKMDARLITASNPLGLRVDDPADPGADDIVTINEFHMPVGRPMYLRLTSKDVIHSFSIPTMRVKQDVIPGMEIPIWFTAVDGATAEELRRQMTETFPVEKASWYRLRHHVAAIDHMGKDGEVVLAQGADLGPTKADGDEKLEALAKTGVTELTMQPRVPLEVVCAQLCGNSHFKMKALLVTHDQAGFDAWIEEKSNPVEPSFEDF